MTTKDQDVLTPRPRHEALWAKDLFEKGIGWIIVARFKSAGRRVEAGVFLVDTFCLGVKLAVYEFCGRRDYLERIRGHYESNFPMISVEPWCARKLVEEAVQYARGLGFAPHADYKKAAHVFGGLRAEQCAHHFAFGLGGKPFYRRGPRETEEQIRRIVWQLEKRCGPGNYDYLVTLGDAEDINPAFD
jgi:hypothetical protein